MEIDKRIYNDTCISKAIYSVMDKMTISRAILSDIREKVEIHCSDTELASNEKIFVNALNDFKLRGIIEAETRDIRTILYAKAFEEDDSLELPEDEFV